jgi:hypothetical protein
MALLYMDCRVRIIKDILPQSKIEMGAEEVLDVGIPAASSITLRSVQHFPYTDFPDTLFSSMSFIP